MKTDNAGQSPEGNDQLCSQVPGMILMIVIMALKENVCRIPFWGSSINASQIIQVEAKS